MPVHEKTGKTPRVVDTDRTLSVYVHDDASMCVPKSEWLWEMVHLDEPDRKAAPDRMLASSMGESYRYLIMECSKEEAWHRIQQMRRAVIAYDKSTD